MEIFKPITGIIIKSMILLLLIFFLVCCLTCHGDLTAKKRNITSPEISDSARGSRTDQEYHFVDTMLILPGNPAPGEPFRILATGGQKIQRAQITVNGPSGSLSSIKIKTGKELPDWRIEDFAGSPAGNYHATLTEDKKVVCNLEFVISPVKATLPAGIVWKTLRGWDRGTEEIYSAWINALFNGCDERATWSALHEVTRNRDQNFLFNYLSLGEDDPGAKISVVMTPDCADNPFYLRAYFAWKLGLPFGYHICDRGSLVHSPRTGKWITNEIPGSKTHPVLAFNTFLRKVMDGVHSGTARTSLDDESSDYYPVSLDQKTLRPGTVFADPYGHTLILVGRIPQAKDHPGVLLAVDAQPDGTVGIKRFWKGNFLFNTTGVVGEPGFKAFRPVSFHNGVSIPVRNKALTESNGFIPFSLQQRKMKTDAFYQIMQRLINPKPLDPEAALTDLIQSLYEQLIVRVTSVANGEEYFKLHPGSVISMPSSAAGIFQAGGQWENFSTPNRDLRLLIAMDAVLGFPELIVTTPGDFNIPKSVSAEELKKKLESELDEKSSELAISFTRSDGSIQKLTLREILKRRDSFEMAYNPNDGAEIRWGAPEKSKEWTACSRHAPLTQLATMRKVRIWFRQRLHPPT
jgi:hypothetical protein